MTLKQDLISLTGKHVVLCEPNTEKFQQVKAFLNNYGIEVHGFSTLDEVKAEIEARRFSTRRLYMMVLIDVYLVEQVQALWEEVTEGNPLLLQTPVVLMHEKKDCDLAEHLMRSGFFRFQVESPIKPVAMLRLLKTLSRWKAIKSEMENQSVEPAAQLGHKI